MSGRIPTKMLLLLAPGPSIKSCSTTPSQCRLVGAQWQETRWQCGATHSIVESTPGHGTVNEGIRVDERVCYTISNQVDADSRVSHSNIVESVSTKHNVQLIHTGKHTYTCTRPQLPRHVWCGRQPRTAHHITHVLYVTAPPLVASSFRAVPDVKPNNSTPLNRRLSSPRPVPLHNTPPAPACRGSATCVCAPTSANDEPTMVSCCNGR